MKKTAPGIRGRGADGTTLVEAVVGLAVLVLILLMLYGGFLVANRVFGEGNAFRSEVEAAFADLEKGAARTEEAAINLALAGSTVTVAGRYEMAGEAGTKTALYAFSPLEREKAAPNLRAACLEWLGIFTAMSQAERAANGYPGAVNNENLRAWVRDHGYGGSWPSLDKAFLQRNGLAAETVYVKPFYDEARDEVYVYAKGDETPGGAARFVYHHEENAWYYRESGVAMNLPWPVLRSQLAAADWKILR